MKLFPFSSSPKQNPSLHTSKITQFRGKTNRVEFPVPFDMAWRHLLWMNRSLLSNSTSGFANFSSKSSPYIVKVGIPEFLNGVGKGLENHVEKLEAEIGDFQKLLVTRTIKLKRIGIPCKDRKLILKYAHKYRLGLWRPRAEPVKS